MITAPTITDAGKELLSRSIGGEEITFTRFAIGNGDQPGEIAGMTDLVNPILYFPISSCDKSKPGYVKINGRFTSSDIESDFRWKELGLLCKGEDGNETLYAYSNDGEKGTWLKAKESDVAAENAVSLVIAIGDAQNVTAITVASAVYAEKKDVDTHVNNKINPHNVTAAQVGLGNVPNVATNDQTPTYDTPDDISNLSSGEKLSIAFGKIRRAILDLIAHIGNKQNPHDVTAEQIKAAQKDHKHSTNEITDGILGVKRGGTGVSDLKAIWPSFSDTYIITGEYTGTGTYGSNKPTVLTFDRLPKILVVQPEECTQSYRGGFIAIQGVTKIMNGGVADATSSNSLTLFVAWRDTSVSWYSTGGSYYQLNASGVTYRYFAIL